MYKYVLKKILGQTTLLFFSGTILGVLGSIGWTAYNSGLTKIITLLGFGLILCAFLTTNKSIVRRFILDNRELEKLISELQTGNPRQRRAAAYKLGISKNSTVVSALIHGYDDVDDSVRQNVIEGLRKIASKEAIDFLNSKEITPISAKVIYGIPFIIIVIFVIIMIVLWIFILNTVMG